MSSGIRALLTFFLLLLSFGTMPGTTPQAARSLGVGAMDVVVRATTDAVRAHPAKPMFIEGEPGSYDLACEDVADDDASSDDDHAVAPPSLAMPNGFAWALASSKISWLLPIARPGRDAVSTGMPRGPPTRGCSRAPWPGR